MRAQNVLNYAIADGHFLRVPTLDAFKVWPRKKIAQPGLPWESHSVPLVSCSCPSEEDASRSLHISGILHPPMTHAGKSIHPVTNCPQLESGRGLSTPHLDCGLQRDHHRWGGRETSSTTTQGDELMKQRKHARPLIGVAYRSKDKPFHLEAGTEGKSVPLSFHC